MEAALFRLLIFCVITLHSFINSTIHKSIQAFAALLCVCPDFALASFRNTHFYFFEGINIFLVCSFSSFA